MITLRIFFRLLIYISIILFSTSLLAAQPLWKISDADSTVYLLGSFHLLKKDQLVLTPEMKNALGRAEVFVFELDLGQAESLDVQTEMVSKILLRDGQSLSALLSETSLERMKIYLKRYGYSLLTVDRFKPWYAAAFLTQMQLKSMGYDPQNGFDHFFYRQAKYRKKKVVGLETAAYQLDRFDKLPMNVQVQFVNETLDELDIFESELNKIITYWRNGDMESLDRYVVEPMRKYPQLYTRLLAQRNHNWIEPIKSYLSDNKDYIVVVGAAHFAGQDGLIKLLDRQGIKAIQY